MSGSDDQERVKELSQLWQTSVVSVEDEAETTVRRDRVVPAVGAAIARARAQRDRRRRTRRAWFGVSVAAAAAVGALAFGMTRRAHPVLTQPPPVAIHAAPAAGSVRASSGVMTVEHAGRSTTVDSSVLAIGDAVTTGLDCKAELRLSDLVVASLGDSSALTIGAAGNAYHHVRLDRGSLDAHVDDRASSVPKLVVETPDATVVVTGTIFRVDVGRDEAGNSETLVSVVKGRVVIQRPGADNAAVRAGETWSSAAAPPFVRTSDAVSQTSVFGPDRSTGLRGFSSRATSGNVIGALAVQNALFQQAADARNRGDAHEAADRFGELLSRYPGSPLAGEARVERMRALARSGRLDEAAHEARRYLAAYPEGFAKDEARRFVLSDGASQ